MSFSNFRDWRPDVWASGLVFVIDRTSRPETLGDLPVGSRLLYRSRTDWRDAVISRITNVKAVLTVISPTGRTYRLSRGLGAPIRKDGKIPVLVETSEEDWRANFADYDIRW